MVRHVVLLGDSIFDNAAYVPGGPPVVEHLQRFLPSSDMATQVAVNNTPASSVFRQLERIPSDATHLVLSAGGNDARWIASNLFNKPTPDIRSALQSLGDAP